MVDFLNRNKYFLICLLLLILFNIFFKIVIVSGDSMQPNFHHGQILISQNYFNVERFNVVTVEESNKKIIKRVIGLPKEKIVIKDNKIYRFVPVNTDRGEGIELPYQFKGKLNDFSIELADDEYFVLGDNVENSVDSRFFGAIERKQILNKVRDK